MVDSNPAARSGDLLRRMGVCMNLDFAPYTTSTAGVMSAVDYLCAVDELGDNSGSWGLARIGRIAKNNPTATRQIEVSAGLGARGWSVCGAADDYGKTLSSQARMVHALQSWQAPIAGFELANEPNRGGNTPTPARWADPAGSTTWTASDPPQTFEWPAPYDLSEKYLTPTETLRAAVRAKAARASAEVAAAAAASTFNKVIPGLVGPQFASKDKVRSYNQSGQMIAPGGWYDVLATRAAELGIPLAGLFQLLAMHEYPNGESPNGTSSDPLTGISAKVRAEGVDVLGALPTWLTETGYHSYLGDVRGVTQEGRALYFARIFLEGLYDVGYTRVNTFQLADTPEKATHEPKEGLFGIFDEAWNPRPSARTGRRLSLLFHDDGRTFSPNPLPATITHPSAVRRMVWQRPSDGAWLVAFWRPGTNVEANTLQHERLTVAPVAASLVFDSPMRVTKWKPGSAPDAPVESSAGVLSTSADVDGEAMILEITPASSSTTGDVLPFTAGLPTSPTTEIAVTLPAGIPDGSLAVAVMMIAAGTGIPVTTGPGWTLHPASPISPSSAQTARLFYRTVGAADSGQTYTLGTTATTAARKMVAAGVVVPRAVGINAVSTRVDDLSTDTTTLLPGVTPTVNGALLVALHGLGFTTTAQGVSANPAGFTPQGLAITASNPPTMAAWVGTRKLTGGANVDTGTAAGTSDPAREAAFVVAIEQLSAALSGEATKLASTATSADGLPRLRGPGSSSASGTLAGSGTRSSTGSAASSSTGTASASGSPLTTGTIAPSASGTLSASGSPARTGTGTPSADGTLVGTGTAGPPNVPGPTTLLADDFSGTDGAPWDAAKWTLGRDGTGTGGATLLGGRGVLSTGNQGAYNGQTRTSRRANIDPRADVEVSGKFTYDASECFLTVFARSNNVIDTGSGYYLQAFKSQTPKIGRSVSYAATNLATLTTSALAAGTTYAFRFRVVGTTVAAKVWPASEAEPAAWHAEVTDSTIATAGATGFTVGGGAAAAASTLTVDDVLITDGVSGPAPITGNGASSATGSLTGTGRASAATSGALSSSGTLTGAGAGSVAQSVSQSASGTLAGTARPSTSASSASSATGGLSATGVPGRSGVGSSSASGDLAASTRASTSGPAATSASGTLLASGTANGQAGGSGTFTASGTSTASGTPRAASSGAAGASGGLTATGRASGAGSLSSSASGALTASGRPNVSGRADSLGSTGALSVTGNGSSEGVGSASTSASGSLTASGRATFARAVDLTASTGGSPLGRPGVSRSASLSASTALAPSSLAGLTGEALLDAVTQFLARADSTEDARDLSIRARLLREAWRARLLPIDPEG